MARGGSRKSVRKGGTKRGRRGGLYGFEWLTGSNSSEETPKGAAPAGATGVNPAPAAGTSVASMMPSIPGFQSTPPSANGAPAAGTSVASMMPSIPSIPGLSSASGAPAPNQPNAVVGGRSRRKSRKSKSRKSRLRKRR